MLILILQQLYDRWNLIYWEHPLLCPPLFLYSCSHSLLSSTSSSSLSSPLVLLLFAVILSLDFNPVPSEAQPSRRGRRPHSSINPACNQRVPGRNEREIVKIFVDHLPTWGGGDEGADTNGYTFSWSSSGGIHSCLYMGKHTHTHTLWRQTHGLQTERGVLQQTVYHRALVPTAWISLGSHLVV